MLWNPGQLPPEWTVERLTEKHSSQPYNPDIANAFFRAGMIESWGRGIERIMDACKAAGVPAPELRYEHTGLWVIFGMASGSTTDDDKSQVTGQVTGQVETWVAQILTACATKAMSRAELQALIGIRHRETFQRNYLNQLLAEHLLERTIPDKPNSRLQKYCLTEAGVAYIKALRKGGD